MFCFVDYRISHTELSNLINLGLTPIKIPQSKLLYLAIDGHVDIQMAILDKDRKNVIFHKDMDISFLEHIKTLGISYTLSKNSLSSIYPNDIFLNALITDNFLMHNLSYTDENLLNAFPHLTKLNIKQGYTNCSILKVSNNAFITSDKKAFNLLVSHNFHALLLPPKDIVLEGLDYGFIGGVGGLINENTMVFFGSLDKYKYGNLVKEFLTKHKVSYIYLKDDYLTDRGSIFVI
ncbi:DUF6873 family GME fold protein [uncultured Clostridium sp.]|uniref:DUF6873 family GME fold protein n=1 Tax=uncultured Clostridium sp. TaxID=59620 RepID=UPI0026268DAC|nr:hypothetical protein [uncultured Clostridium sp.]